MALGMIANRQRIRLETHAPARWSRLRGYAWGCCVSLTQSLTQIKHAH
jgi:hypothetical protein